MSKDAQEKRPRGHPPIWDEGVDPLAIKLWCKGVRSLLGEPLITGNAINKVFWPKKFDRNYSIDSSETVKPKGFTLYLKGERMPNSATRKDVDNKLGKPVSHWLGLPLFELMRKPKMSSKDIYPLLLPYPRLAESLYDSAGPTTMIAGKRRGPERLASFLSQLDAEGDVGALTACVVLMRQTAENNDALGYMRSQQTAYRILMRLVMLWPWSEYWEPFCACFYERLLSVLDVPTARIGKRNSNNGWIIVKTSAWMPPFCPDFDEFKKELKIRLELLRHMTDLGLLDPNPKAHRACIHAAETLGLPAIMAALKQYAPDLNRYSASLDPQISELRAAIEQSRAIVDDLPGITISIKPLQELIEAVAVHADLIPR